MNIEYFFGIKVTYSTCWISFLIYETNLSSVTINFKGLDSFKKYFGWYIGSAILNFQILTSNSELVTLKTH